MFGKKSKSSKKSNVEASSEMTKSTKGCSAKTESKTKASK